MEKNVPEQKRPMSLWAGKKGLNSFVGTGTQKEKVRERGKRCQLL